MVAPGGSGDGGSRTVVRDGGTEGVGTVAHDELAPVVCP